MTAAQLALALAVAQVSVNEAGWSSPADVALVYQATEAHGSTPEERLDWLKRHSWTVFDLSRPATGNARFTRHLAWSDAEPEGWPEDAPPWSRYVERWRQIRRLAAALVTGRVQRRPCRGRVVTWGSIADRPGAIARGLVPLECGTRNIGFARGPRRGDAS